MKLYDYMYLVPKDQYESKSDAGESLARVGGNLQESQFNKIEVSNGGTVIIREGIQGSSAPLETSLREDSPTSSRTRGDGDNARASKTASSRGKEEGEEEEEESGKARGRAASQAYRSHGRHPSQDAQFDILRRGGGEEEEGIFSPASLLELEERGHGGYAAASKKLPAKKEDLRTKVLLRNLERERDEARQRGKIEPFTDSDDVDMQSVASERAPIEDMDIDDEDEEILPASKDKKEEKKRKKRSLAEFDAAATKRQREKNGEAQMRHELREAFKEKKISEAATKYPASRFPSRSRSDVLAGVPSQNKWTPVTDHAHHNHSQEKSQNEWTPVADHAHNNSQGKSRKRFAEPLSPQANKRQSRIAVRRKREEDLDELTNKYENLTKRVATRPPPPGQSVPEKRKIEGDVDGFLDALTGRKIKQAKRRSVKRGQLEEMRQQIDHLKRNKGVKRDREEDEMSEREHKKLQMRGVKRDREDEMLERSTRGYKCGGRKKR